MQETRPFISWKLAEEFMTAVFEKYGVPKEDAAVCADVLIESDRRGIESHGCNRFKPIYIDRIKEGILNPETNFEVIKETPATAVVDGHNGMGMVVGTRAMQMAIDKAKQYGMGMVAVRNSTHSAYLWRREYAWDEPDHLRTSYRRAVSLRAGLRYVYLPAGKDRILRAQRDGYAGGHGYWK